MILPGKSGVTVQGLLTGTELAAPASLAARQLENTALRRVGYTDLDRNGHMNNTRYLEWMDDLLPSSFHRDFVPAEFTVCYHSEAREGDNLQMSWQINQENLFQVESWKEDGEGTPHHRIFAAQIRFDSEIL